VTTKPVLGLIGGIGAGKSAAAAGLAALGAGVIDCDKLGHAVLETPPVVRQLTARWGGEILRSDGGIDRRAVAGIVFADPAERLALEAILFPAIGARAAEAVVAARSDPAVRFAVLDAAVLLEAGWHDACTRIVYIDAPRDVRLHRLHARGGWTDADLTAREAAQWPAGRKKAAADAVVENVGSIADLYARLGSLVTGWGW